MDCSPLGSSVRRISQARILEWILPLKFPSSGHLPDPGIEPASPAWQADSSPLSHLGSRSTGPRGWPRRHGELRAAGYRTTVGREEEVLERGEEACCWPEQTLGLSEGTLALQSSDFSLSLFLSCLVSPARGCLWSGSTGRPVVALSWEGGGGSQGATLRRCPQL